MKRETYKELVKRLNFIIPDAGYKFINSNKDTISILIYSEVKNNRFKEIISILDNCILLEKNNTKTSNWLYQYLLKFNRN